LSITKARRRAGKVAVKTKVNRTNQRASLASSVHSQGANTMLTRGLCHADPRG